MATERSIFESQLCHYLLCDFSYVSSPYFAHYKMGRIKSAFCPSQGYIRGPNEIMEVNGLWKVTCKYQGCNLLLLEEKEVKLMQTIKQQFLSSWWWRREREKELTQDYGPRGLQERLMLPLGNRGSNNPELWPSQPKGCRALCPGWHIHDSVFFFFFWGRIVWLLT